MEFDFVSQIQQKSDAELNDIFINAKNYNPDFIRLVEQELHKRDISLDTSIQVREEIQQIDDEQLAIGKQGSPLYMFICFVLAIFGGLIAIYAGYIYSQSKTIGNNGQSFYVYNKQTRELGNIMMWIGIGVLVLVLLRSTLFV